MTFDQLVEEATLRIHGALLEGGGPAMKAAVYLWLQQAIIWKEKNEKKTT